MFREINPLGKVASDQSTPILVAASLPSAVWISQVELIEDAVSRLNKRLGETLKSKTPAKAFFNINSVLTPNIALNYLNPRKLT
ncbi:hypothetical protein CMK12_02405 [Candidatus Poribacteria bacterium]|jgi:hypothetical protein|nr:hypothetical protein [Candidatus Poribacteria bacterium]